ncbi:MAG: cation transporter [Treponema sp.]|nr:cation transporter [Treponema sp.]
MEKVVLKVDGMTCEHCVKAVVNAIVDLGGTADVSVDLGAGSVSFSYDPGKTSLQAIKDVITEEEYTVID